MNAILEWVHSQPPEAYWAGGAMVAMLVALIVFAIWFFIVRRRGENHKIHCVVCTKLRPSEGACPHCGHTGSSVDVMEMR